MLTSNKGSVYEYKVLTLGVKECEETFNRWAKEGWRVVTVLPDQMRGLIAVLERIAEAN